MKGQRKAAHSEKKPRQGELAVPTPKGKGSYIIRYPFFFVIYVCAGLCSISSVAPQ